MRIVLVIIIGSLLAAVHSGPAQTDTAAAAPAKAALPPALQPRVNVPPVAPVAGAPAPAAPAPGAPAAGVKSAGMINFQGAPLTAVLEYYARLTKRSIIQGPQLAGTIFFTSQTDLTVEEAIQALDTVLAVNGIGVVPMGEKFLKVVQIPAAKQEGIAVNIGMGEGRPWPAADTLVTQILPLKYADAQEVIAALQPYMHAYGQMMALAKSNSILITETGGNLNQMLEIVKYIDQPSQARMETRIYVLLHAKAPDVVQRIQQLIQESQQASTRSGAAPAAPQPAMPQPLAPRPMLGARPATSGTAGTPTEDSLIEGKVIMTADERTNKMFILSRPSNFEFFEKIIAELDMKVEPDIQTKVVELKYAQAEDASSLLMSLLTGGSGGGTTRRTTGTGSSSSRSSSSSSSRSGSMVPPPPMGMGMGGSSLGGSTGAGAAALEAAGFLQYAEGVRVLPDPRTNSLLVMATKEDMKRLEKLIEDIDTAVAQVLIEVVIVEVDLNNVLDTGVNWVNRVMQEGSAVRTYGGSMPATAPQPVNLFDTATKVGMATPQGAALGSALTYFASLKGMKMDVAINLLSSLGKTKVLSRPIIQTLHNQEASIIDGKSVPVPASTMSSYGGYSGSSNSLGLQAAIEYKDVAIELKVTPRINPDGFVTMEIAQKHNDLVENGAVDIGGIKAPTITKRETKSFVTVKDQSTIVLGGMIQDHNDLTETKVPFLGDIPFLGQAFKSKHVKKVRSELIVFIRPMVLRSTAQAFAEAQRRAQMIKGSEELQLERYFDGGYTTNPPPATVVPPAAVEPAKPVPPDPPRSDDNRPATNTPPAAATSPTRSATDVERAAVKARVLRGLAPGEE